MRDFFFEVKDSETARLVLKRLVHEWPDDVLTGVHALLHHSGPGWIVGASFAGGIEVTGPRIAVVAGPLAKLTELTLEKVFTRMRRKEYDVALLGNAAMILGVEDDR